MQKKKKLNKKGTITKIGKNTLRTSAVKKKRIN